MERTAYLSGSHNSGYPVTLVSVTSRVHKFQYKVYTVVLSCHLNTENTEAGELQV